MIENEKTITTRAGITNQPAESTHRSIPSSASASEPPRPLRFPRLVRFWNILTRPHPGILEPGNRQQAQLAVAISLGLGVFTLIGMIAGFAVTGWTNNSFVLLVLTFVIFLIYGITRSQYYKWGSAVLTLLFVAGGFGLALSNPGREGIEFFTMLPIALILGSLLLPMWGLVALTGVIFLSVILFPNIAATYVVSDATTNSGILLTAGILLIIAVAYRNAVERLRVAEVTEVNKELQVIQVSLEQRVAAATRNLTLAAEVSRSVTQVHDLNTLLKNAVDLIQNRFNLYYAQVYLLDPTGRQLILQSGTGTVGQQLLSRRHSLPVDLASMNGIAAADKHAVIVENTETSTIHRPNPLLPDTRSEMVVPLLVGERVVGTLDMQSSQSGALNQENLAAFETLAGQLAIAVENAELLTETEAARTIVEAQSRRLIHSGWQDFLNAIDRGERIGYSYDLENVTPMNEPIPLEQDGVALMKTIPVMNEPVGLLKFEGAQMWSEEDVALVDNVAQQLGQQIENLRLLSQADQYRAESENVIRQLTRQGWESEISVHPDAKTGFAYDLNIVSTLPAAGQGNTTPMITQTLEILGEKIGELTALETNLPREEVAELLSKVGEQLSARVENLRLFEETERSQVEVGKRAHQLAAVAEVSTVSSRELNIDKMLQSVVHLTQRQFGLYHAHIFLYDEKTEELKVAACGWKEGDEHEGSHETASISINKEQSLVARAARTRQAVIVNDVHNEPDWLPNPLLPGTASEMAVPLIIGDQAVGVLDVQSERLNAFSEEDANIQTTLASQVAIAMQNARSFAQAQHQAERETMLNTIGQKIRSATSVEAVLQIAARELGHALGAPLTIAQLGLKDNK
jgi:GAF domain-containing protein